MSETSHKKSKSHAWLLALIIITAASATVYTITFLMDSAGQPGVSLVNLLTGPGMENALVNIPEVIAGVLGIAITVVAIIVELASNRYTPRVTELFVRSPVNLAVLGFFVVTALMCIWVSLTGSSPDFAPRAGRTVAVFAITASILALLPYFAFVFGFLNPHNIIESMGRSTLLAIRKIIRRDNAQNPRIKLSAVRGIEQLADVALNSIEHKDKGICMHAIDNLGELTRNYLDTKSLMPKSWFSLDTNLRENPDFISMQNEVLEDIEAGEFWFEMKVLRQYQMLFGETLNRMRDINYLIAINVRKLAEKALRLGQEQTASMTVKFFNTFLRTTINERDVRTAYNVLNQYRLLAETAMKLQRADMAVDVALRFKYYGQLGFAQGLPFVLETAAYDLCSLNELAFHLGSPCRDDLIKIFLEVDKEAEEGHEFEASLRGVRKAQVKLATYYLIHDAEDLARIIYMDMRSELPHRLVSIREELAGITSKDFWEVSDRGVNFDYLEPKRRAKLELFFSWFS